MSLPSSPNGHPLYRIHYSAKLWRDILQCQWRASREGRGGQFIAALRKLVEKLQIKPGVLGEALYRLPALQLQIRCVIIRPVYADFGVSEVSRVVYLRAIKLLPAPAR